MIKAKVKLPDSEYIVMEDGDPNVLISKLENKIDISLKDNDNWLNELDDLLNKDDDFYLKSLVDNTYYTENIDYYYMVDEEQNIYYKDSKDSEWEKN